MTLYKFITYKTIEGKGTISYYKQKQNETTQTNRKQNKEITNFFTLILYYNKGHEFMSVQ